MKLPVIAFLGLAAAVSATDVVKGVIRDSNTRASTARGLEQYGKKKYAESAKSFGKAADIDRGPRTAFNLGTAKIAAGDLEGGAKVLGAAEGDKSLAPDAHFNRGTAELQSKQWEPAIRDFIDTLRQRPDDASAKRNLEIAIRQKKEEEQKRQQQQQKNQQQQQQNKDQKQNQDGGGDKKQQPGQPDVDQILRSVQQQEQEELNRMRHASPQRKKDW